jgi:hypothetical protein
MLHVHSSGWYFCFIVYVILYSFSPADDHLSRLQLFPVIVRLWSSQIEHKQFHTPSTLNKAICEYDRSGQKAGALCNHVDYRQKDEHCLNNKTDRAHLYPG